MSGTSSYASAKAVHQQSHTNGQHNPNTVANALSEMQLGNYAGLHEPSFALPAHLQPSFGLQDLHLACAKIAEEFHRNKQPLDDNSSNVPAPSLTLVRLLGNSYFAEPYMPLNQRQQQVKQGHIGRPTNLSSASSSYSVPGMVKQSQRQEASSSRMPLPSGSSPRTDDDKWGLIGFLSTLRNKGNPNNMHQGVGIDLRTLGLDLASKGELFRTFASPWVEEPLKEEPIFSIPACYNKNQTPPTNYARISKMNERTLFYIFYSMPKDKLQLYAAHTLATRGWMYHRGLHLWLIKDPNLTYYRLADNRERGSFICFNPNTFVPTRKTDFVLDYDLIEPMPELTPIN